AAHLTSILVGADVVGRAPGPEDAGEVERRYAEGHAGGTEGRSGIDRHGAAAKMVISRHVPGVVHEQGTELGARERQGAGLGAVYERQVRRIVVEDVVVVDIVGANRTGRGFPNAVPIDIHHDVVVDGRVIVRCDGRIGRDLNAIAPAFGHHVVGDDQVGGAVVGLDAGRGGPGDDIVLDHAIRAGHVDAVGLVHLPPGADIVHHIANDLNTYLGVVAAG